MDLAESDLSHAVLSLGSGHHEWACFASHQAAEKALKALILERTGRLQRGHDLTRLAGDAGASVETVRACTDLSPAYVGTRYPDAPPYPAAARSQIDVTTAQEVITWVRSLLS